MSNNRVLLDGERIISIHYNSFNKSSRKEESFDYDVLCTADTLDDKCIFAFVRREDGQYGILELCDYEVSAIVASGYDDIYFPGGETTYNLESLYESVECYYQQGGNWKEELLLVYQSDEPLCLVKKGVGKLLTCTPVLFSYYSAEGNGWRLGVPFICESFSKEYIFINGATIHHNIKTGDLGRAWYRENHHTVNYDDGGYNQWACYLYMYNEYGSLGAKKWRVVDENNPTHFYDDIEADDIIMANLWSSICDVIGVTLNGANCLYFFHKGPESHIDRIQCTNWYVVNTRNDVIYFIVTENGMIIYSCLQGKLSDRLYIPKRPKPRIENESLKMEYYTLSHEICSDILFVDSDGTASIRKV